MIDLNMKPRKEEPKLPEDWQIAQLVICVILWAIVLIGIGRAL